MRKLWTPRWLLVHAAALILAVGFLLLCWWQVGRAVNGNLLSFGYAIEWPAFSAFVVYVWVKEARQAVRGDREAPAHTDAVPAQTSAETSAVASTDPPVLTARVRRRQVRNEAAYDDSGDGELAAYNRYLAWLNAHPNASRAEYPG
jgi:DNA-binding transcriptional regulator of glucitol operon